MIATMILILLACSSECGGTTTRTTWSFGDVAVELDGVVGTVHDATLDRIDLNQTFSLRATVAGVVADCDGSGKI